MNKMRTDLELLKSLYLPEFQRLPSFATTLEKKISNESFWNNFNSILLSSKELNTELTDYFKKYAPDNFENLVDRVAKIKKEYLSYLANDFCNDHTNPSIELLLQNQNQEFLEEISFEKDLIIAITHTERTRLKKKLSLTDEGLEFEITDAEINSAFDIIEREDLKNKMKEWDNEPDSKPIQIKFEPIVPKVPAKRISLSYFSYAAAACFVGILVWIGIKYSNERKTDNNFALNKQDTLKTINPKPEFAKVEVSQNTIPLLKQLGIGFGNTGKLNKINIVVQNLKPRILSIQEFLNKSVTDTSLNQLRKNAGEELQSLKKMESSYIFDGEILHLFTPLDAHVENNIIEMEGGKFYLKEGKNYFQLKKTDKPLELKRVTDNDLIENIERVVFDAKN